MATPNSGVRYATDVFDANGTQTDWQISFIGGYIDATHVYAYSQRLDPATGLLTDRQDHAVEVLAEDDDSSTVRIAPAVGAGRKLFIFRSTPVMKMLVDYVNGSIINKSNLNLANDQLLKIIQEMLDTVNFTNLSVDQQLDIVIDLDKLVREVYEEVLKLIAAGGIISVSPRVWTWTTESGTTDYLMPGADVDSAGMYDTYMEGSGLIPDTDYTVELIDGDLTQSTLRLLFDPPEGAVLFTVLRGFAQPYQGAPPATIADLRTPVINVTGGVYFPTLETDRALVKCWSDAGTNISVGPIPEAGSAASKLGTGSYFTVRQKGIGQVLITPEAGVTVEYPSDCLARTRTAGSAITLTCEDAENNIWLLTGDMATA